MNAMPSLNGSVGYIFTSCDLDVKNSGNVPFKDMIERFKVYDKPRRPEGRVEEWLAGERVDARGVFPEHAISMKCFCTDVQFRIFAIWSLLPADGKIRCFILYTNIPDNTSIGGCYFRPSSKVVTGQAV